MQESLLKKYLSQNNLVEKVLNLDEALSLSSRENSANIMMGQTFDFGQPVDMMKYGLFIMNLQDILSSEGMDVNSKWLIADHFISEINQDKSSSEVSKLADERIAYLNEMNSAYGGNIETVLSSELSQTPKYKRNLEVLFNEANRNPYFRDLVLKAVPEDRRDNPNALDYPFEELATIESMDANVKSWS
jgi:hypothetical protein